MYQPYFDITEKLGAPLWWDEEGVPRYKPFEPGMCSDIYAKYAALISIRCQGCNCCFPVAATWSVMRDVMLKGWPEKYIVWDENGQNAKPADGLPTDGEAGFCGYGDAPWHGESQCAGTTMTTDVVRILEFWGKKSIEWERLPEHEVYVGEDENLPA